MLSDSEASDRLVNRSKDSSLSLRMTINLYELLQIQYRKSDIRYFNLPLQPVQYINIDRVGIAVYHYYDGQSYSNFCSSQSHNKEYEYLTAGVAAVHRKSGKQQVNRVKHQLDRHKYDDRISAQQHTHYTYREDDSAQ
jgi:hypothetical protein